MHPEAPDLDTDLRYLKTKVDSGAGFLITQLFFDNQVYFDFVRAARERGIEVPIIAGVIPVASFAQTKRICDLCDATIPPRLEAAFEAAGGDPEREFELGIAFAAQQCAELLIAGAPGIHFYALNRAPATRAVLGVPAGLAALGAGSEATPPRWQPWQNRFRAWVRESAKESGCGRSGSQPKQSDNQSGRNRLIVGYAIVATVVLAVAVLVFVLVSGGGDSGSGNDDGGAHINLNQRSRQHERRRSRTSGPGSSRRGPRCPTSSQAAKEAAANCALKLEDEGNTHLPQNVARCPNYKTNPPTSGNHVEPPFQQADGAYSEEPNQLDVVHSLEHGRLAIEYSPDLPEKAQLELKGLYDTMYGATLLFPNDEMPYDVAAATWTNLLACRPTRARPRSTRSAPSARNLGQIRRRAGGSLRLHRADAGGTRRTEQLAPTRRGRRGSSRQLRGRR